MRMKYFVAAIAFLPLLSGCKVAGSDDEDSVAGESAAEVAAAMSKGRVASLKPGLWESKLTVKEIAVPGVASGRKEKMVARVEKNGTHERCLSAKEAKAPPADLFVKNAQECRYSHFEVVGGKATIALSCRMASVGAIDMDLSGPITPDAYIFDADIALRLPMIGTVPIKASLTSSHKGECSDASSPN